MRSTPGPGIGFFSAGADTPFCVSAGDSGEVFHHSASGAGLCALDFSSQCRGPSLGSPVCKSSPASSVVSVGHLSWAQTSVSRAAGTPAHFGIQCRSGTRLTDRLCNSGDAWLQQECLSMDSGDTPVPSQDAACNEGARSAQATDSSAPAEANGSSCRFQRGSFTPPASSDPHETFVSSFSFIQLSLGSVGERGEAEGCLPSRKAESPHRSHLDMGAEAACSDRPHEDHECLSVSFSPTATQSSTDLAQQARSSFWPEWDMLSSLDFDTGSSLGPMLPGCCGDKGHSSEDAHGWDALLMRWEPVLHDCLQNSSRQLEVSVSVVPGWHWA